MRYFQSKANCSICNKDLNLFSFNKRYMLKDGWLCSDCTKKFNLFIRFNKTTLKEVNECIAKANQFAPTQTNPLLYNKTLHVKGISYHQSDLLKILKKGVNKGVIEKFDGLTKKERIEECEEYNGCVGEFSGESIDVKLNLNKFENNDAIEVLANDFDDNYILIGYIPKEEVSQIVPLFKNEIIIWAKIIGGPQYYYSDDDIDIEELDFGVELLIKIFDH